MPPRPNWPVAIGDVSVPFTVHMAVAETASPRTVAIAAAVMTV
jgi:hypothetical protein